MDIELLKDGFLVMCVGFSVVFIFLSILIFAMNIMGKVIGYINKLCPEPALINTQAKQAPSSANEEIAVAIAAVLARN